MIFLSSEVSRGFLGWGIVGRVFTAIRLRSSADLRSGQCLTTSHNWPGQRVTSWWQAKQWPHPFMNLWPWTVTWWVSLASWARVKSWLSLVLGIWVVSLLTVFSMSTCSDFLRQVPTNKGTGFGSWPSAFFLWLLPTLFGSSPNILYFSVWKIPLSITKFPPSLPSFLSSFFQLYWDIVDP